jgi:hypothetical protein
MVNSTSKPMTLRTSEEIRENFKRTYEASGATSQNEFLGMLLKRWITPDEIKEMATNSEAIEFLPNLSLEETQEILKSSFEASKADTMEAFLDNLIQNFSKPEKVADPDPEPESTSIELQPNEILISLTPAQLYAIRETVLTEGFAEAQNKIIDSWNYKKQGNWYSGLISEPEFEPLWVRNEPINEGMSTEQKEAAISHNASALLVNMCLTSLIEGKIKTTDFKPKTLRSFLKENSPACNVSNLDTGKKLKDNEILLQLTPAQMFGISETIMSPDNFADIQNKIIDSLKPENKPFFYFGNLFEPEFEQLWVKSEPLNEELTPEQKEIIIKHNISAFLINMFLTHLIEGKISDSVVTAESLKSFIRDQQGN